MRSWHRQLPPQTFAASWTRLQALARQMGRDPTSLHRCVYTTLNSNNDVSQAERELCASVEGYYGAPYEFISGQQGLCAGGPDAWVQWLKDFVAAGAQTVVVRFDGPDQFGHLERCVQEVLPRLA
jgi:alkanesulfonate monooxygenase SsuD/methylene tetrahydromethanopterin reductase-like flavin-dependent oxidoreductase (luciferase family)